MKISWLFLRDQDWTFIKRTKNKEPWFCLCNPGNKDVIFLFKTSFPNFLSPEVLNVFILLMHSFNSSISGGISRFLESQGMQIHPAPLGGVRNFHVPLCLLGEWHYNNNNGNIKEDPSLSWTRCVHFHIPILVNIYILLMFHQIQFNILSFSFTNISCIAI